MNEPNPNYPENKAPRLKASPEKWEKIKQRAGEIAMNHGRKPEEANEEDWRRAEREQLGLQTLADPENPGPGESLKPAPPK